VSLLALATSSLAQTTINVGSGQAYTTIQAGINAANNGDTVLVAPGTYYENINFNGKAITVASSGGAAVTTINRGSKGGVATVIFNSRETSASVISNFTIKGGGDAIFTGSYEANEECP
jgi:pectin methylesterase-like acyl-CoA thioesterase